MIREALRRLHVRWFRQPATSVSPKTRHFIIGSDGRTMGPVMPFDLDRIEEAAQRLYGADDLGGIERVSREELDRRSGSGDRVDAHLRRIFPEHTAEELAAMRASADRQVDAMLKDGAKYKKAFAEGLEAMRIAGTKPPADPETDGWTWEAWAKESDAGTLPGWAFCRFAHRTGPADAIKATFVFGIVRGAFGIWTRPLDVCKWDDENETTEQTSDVFACVTHLRSGVGLGVFARRADAAAACDLASRACPNWQSVNFEDHANWSWHLNRTLAAWEGIGIRPAVNAHAHDQHAAYHIMGLSPESASIGKPEKLS